MDRSEEIRLIREIIGLAEQKSAYLDETISHSPISRYSSPDRFAREEAALFRRQPVVAAHSGELAGPESFVTRLVMGLPVLLVRDGAGKVRAFLNVCRHRGAKLERDATGCKRVFTCPYHGWSWTNQGDLRAVPQEQQGFPDLPRAERGLRRLPVAEAHGFIWIIANPEISGPLNIDDWLGPVSDDLGWLDLANHKIAVETTIEVKANWKVLVEGGIEAYHFRVAHAKTIAPFFPDNLSTYCCFGPHIRTVLPRTTMPDLANTPEAEWQIRRDSNVVYTVIPTTQFLVQQDHVVWINAQPRAQDHTTLRIATLAPASRLDGDEMQAHWVRNQKITMATLIEDFDLGEEIQSGFASGGNPSHLFGRFEGALNRFNLTVEELMAG
ncbi:aromatic ring-hydroxylating dioxygenase subunit alpha [Tropicibacter sp. Alg240-R139]|uniref:aromatic ring-hydroxylating oxygenase subunit alpha n=1 Tax=Tropicibacter sp. Alg240-R139 TaxID=2305991 RepID=UPI0013E0D0F1|nr:SRPBCC family protein [Tropicibacter sp. Alg240-R139]